MVLLKRLLLLVWKEAIFGETTLLASFGSSPPANETARRGS